MKAADAENNWKQLDAAITQATKAGVDEPTIEPFRKRKVELRAKQRLTECLAMGEDGYTELQSVYDDAIKAGLSGADVDEAAKLLELIRNAQRHFVGSFENWMGGGYEKPESDADGAPLVDNQFWVDNPQFKLVMGTEDADGFRMQVSVDKSGDAQYDSIAFHVVHVTEEGVTQVGSKEGKPVVLQSEYCDTETAKGSYDALPGATYFIIISTRAPKPLGDFSITTVGVGDYTLTECKPLVQGEIKKAMSEKTFEKLPALVTAAEGTAGLSWHPFVQGAKLIGDIEAGWQAKSADMMGPAIQEAKGKVDKAVIRLYAKRYKQLAIENKLNEGLAGNTALLNAVVDECNIIEYKGELLKKAEAALKKFKCKKVMTNIMEDDNAAGAMKFGGRTRRIS